jgi:uncharacterized protein (TIGR04255 family)
VDYVLNRQSTVPPRPEHLPDFDNPPVVETVLSVQFEPLALLHTAQLGFLWDEYRRAFPQSGDRPPLDQVIELFPESPVARVGLKFQAFDQNFPTPRICFINDRGGEMIQVQNDRFIKNWRKEGEGNQYPHYDETIRPNFDRDYAVFLAFLEKNELGIPRVNQCEVTYVNHIIAGQGWDRYGDIEKVFTFWQSPALVPPGPVEDLRLHARFVIPAPDGKPIGRLHVALQPAFRTSDNHPMYVLHLTARGHVGAGVDFFDIGREWIVTTFKRLTTNSMHKVWRIKGDAGFGKR